MSAEPPILEIERLSVDYRTESGPAPAVREVGFSLRRGESLGLVGESGSGKTTIGLAVIRHLADNGYIAAGTIRFEGIDLVPLAPAELRRVRGQRIAMVYRTGQCAHLDRIGVSYRWSSASGPSLEARLRRKTVS